jgi:hypothetical protein
MNTWALIVITLSSGTAQSGYELRQHFGSEITCLKMAETVKYNLKVKEFATLCLPVLPDGAFELPSKRLKS